VNESQSKILLENLAYIPKSTRTPLVQLSQDRLAIDKLSTFGTGLGAATKAQTGANTITREIDNKID
jgi:hypothetical protein